LKETKLESFTGYVEGHETDEGFNLTLDSIELDKYTVRIKSNKLIESDVYKFVALGTFEGQELKQEVVFNWGIFNSTLFLERLDALNKEKTIIPIIENETNPRKRTKYLKIYRGLKFSKWFLLGVVGYLFIVILITQ